MKLLSGIRPYLITDRPALIRIFMGNVPEFFAEHELREFLDYLQHFGKEYYVLESENRLVGGVGFDYREEDHSGRINWIFVDPEYKGCGYGRQAVHFCMEQLQQDQRVKKLVIRTSQLAFQFFEQFGYRLIAQQKDYWAPGLDLYLMEQPVLRKPIE